MPLFARCLRTFGALIGVLFTCGVMAWWSQRSSLAYLAILASVALPVAYWTRRRAWPLTAMFFGLAVVCVVSPLDLVFRSTGERGIRVLPVSFGVGCRVGTVCRGCELPFFPLRYAVVVSTEGDPLCSRL